MYPENRFKMLTKINPDVAKTLLEQAQADVEAHFTLYQFMASRPGSANGAQNGNVQAAVANKA
jgi:pyruvate-ferredoxin/flavodoxin oxidoreductase